MGNDLAHERGPRWARYIQDAGNLHALDFQTSEFGMPSKSRQLRKLTDKMAFLNLTVEFFTKI